jgi:cell division protein FtsA
VLGIGGEHVTRDIAICLQTPVQHAEQMKISSGHALKGSLADNETITVPGIGDRAARAIARRDLVSIIEPRMEELLLLINGEIESSGYKHLIPTGVVLTGGASLLNGTAELAESIFGCPVRLGRPRMIVDGTEGLENPAYATGVGIARYGLRYRAEGGHARFNKGNRIAKTLHGMKRWITEYF